jgi:hypothetical protein
LLFAKLLSQGRNETGKTFSQEAVGAVIREVELTPLKLLCPASLIEMETSRVASIAVSDTHKRLMLKYSPQLITYLTQCLLINDDTPWRGTDDADALQEASTLALHQLALFAPWAEVLKSNGTVIPALREVLKVGSQGAQESAAAALFELDEASRASVLTHASENIFDGSDQQTTVKPPQHIMVSYNWGHQAVILRIVSALQARGYLMWIDTEQMKGATVDTMALAVEGSVVMLLGVSKAYKESSNCRELFAPKARKSLFLCSVGVCSSSSDALDTGMEAQYGLQKKKPLVPVKLTDGYDPDGWVRTPPISCCQLTHKARIVVMRSLACYSALLCGMRSMAWSWILTLPSMSASRRFVAS